MHVTVMDIARACGVSHTTVVRALNNTGRISTQTRERIKQMAKEMDYRPDFLARSFASGRTMTLGVIVVDLRNQYFPIMIDTMVNFARSHSYMLNIGLHENNQRLEYDLLRTMVGYHVDGIILSPSTLKTSEVSFYQSLKIPFVFIGYGLSEKISCVGINEINATHDIMQEILGKKYERIIFTVPIAEDNFVHMSGHAQRLQGVRNEVEKANNVELKIVSAYQDYARIVYNTVKGSKKRTAILCSAEMYANRIIQYMTAENMHYGVDYGIASFDAMDVFKIPGCDLVTVNNQIEIIGKKAVETLIALIEGEQAPLHIEVPYNIISGNTL